MTNKQLLEEALALIADGYPSEAAKLLEKLYEIL